MTVRTLIYKAMVGSPVVLMALLGAYSRLSYDAYEFVSPTPKQNESILNYRPYVTEANSILKARADDVSLSACRTVSKDWIEGFKSTKLVALNQISYDDSSRDGVKGEITKTWMELATVLNHASLTEARAQKYEDSAEDALLVYQLLSRLKYSDYGSLMIGATAQRRSLRTILNISDKLKPETRSMIAREIVRLYPERESLRRLNALDKTLYKMYLDHMQVQATPIETEPVQILSTGILSRRGRKSLLLASMNDTIRPLSALGTEVAVKTELEVENLATEVEHKFHGEVRD